MSSLSDILVPDVGHLDTQDERAFIVDVNGFEGPLDLLLTLAKKQKVDLREISVVQLAKQYLAFIEVVRLRQLELAADYLVMAAWLAYLKSHLLLPKPPETEDETEDMAAHLAHQLERLQAMRTASENLFARAQLGHDFFARGHIEAAKTRTVTQWSATLMDIMHAYARCKTRDSYQPLHLERQAVYAVDEALVRLRSILGDLVEWQTLVTYLPASWSKPETVRSSLASTFAACLELAKEGKLELRQDGAFLPIRIKSTTPIEVHHDALDTV